MTQPLVSIVIANFNYGAFLGEAIESALAQTHRPIEVIVVDDGSTDDSVQVANRYPVRVLQQPNRGVGHARNLGARGAGGDYIMFLDADDVLKPDYLARCIDALQRAPEDTVYAYTQMEMFGAETGLFASQTFDPRALLKHNFVNASALIRRDVFVLAGGFDSSWRLGYEDYELWVRLLSLGYRGVLVPEPLLRYRRHATSRNALSQREKKSLEWRLRGSYPRLYLWLLWRRPLQIPQFLFWIARVQLAGP